MTIEFAKQDKHGSYQVSFKDRIFEVSVIGSIGDSLTQHFAKQLKTAFDSVKEKHWAFFANLKDCDGFTPGSEGLLAKTMQFALVAGCVVDAFVIKSPLVRAQVDRIRQQAEVSSPLHYHAFDEREKALAYIQSVLDNRSSPINE